MKIAYCIRSLKGAGGMARVLANKANYMAEKLGYEVTIITLDEPDYKPFFEFSPLIRRYGLGIEYADSRKVFPLFSPWVTLMNMWKHWKALEKLLKQIRVDIVVSMFDSEARFLYRIQDGSKKVVELHFSKWGREQHNKSAGGRMVDFLKKKYDDRVVNKYDAFVVLTEEDKNCWKYVRNTHVIPNALMFKSGGTATLENKYVVAVGKLTAQKGFDFLIDIWQRVNLRHPDWRLKIVGEGEDRILLEKKIVKNTLEGKVEIVPFTKDVASCYTESSIYVMTSRYEGFPMVLIEAMACGLPAVSFACPSGPSEIITDGKDGYLIPVGDFDLFAQRICQLIEDDEWRKKMGCWAKRNVERFSEDQIMEKWHKLFTSIRAKDDK